MVKSKQFWVVAGAGHCGTQWLSYVFEQLYGWRGYHELRYGLLKTSWPNAHAEDPQAYWDHIREERRFNNVLDSNSWSPTELPLVNKVEPIDRVIYLVRHPILQFHSLKEKSSAWRDLPFTSYAYSHWLRDWWEVSDVRQTCDYNELSRIERLCLLVRGNMYMPQYLRNQGLNVVIYRLEDLTTNLDILGQVVNLPPSRLITLQEMDINRKVRGSRDPKMLWESWTSEEHDAFRNLCHQAAVCYNYDIGGIYG